MAIGKLTDQRNRAKLAWLETGPALLQNQIRPRNDALQKRPDMSHLDVRLSR